MTGPSRTGAPLALLILLGGQANAQETATCAAAASAISAIARPDVVSDSSATFRRLFGCPVSGPPQIARIWQVPGLSEIEVRRLLGYTVAILDTRILAALRAVSQTASASSIVRQSAIAAMLPYVDASVTTNIDYLSRFERRRPTVTHEFDAPRAIVGASAPSSGSIEEISTTLSSIARSTSDRRLKNVAIAGLRATYLASPSAVAIDASNINLSYVCGNKFLVRSGVLTGLNLRYEVSGTSDSREFVALVPAEDSTESRTFFHTLRRGPVRLIHRSRILATATNNGTACN